MDLSVQSALARVGKDPWTEAARLAGLLRAAAADSLAATIAGLPAGSWPRALARMIALCLVPLLPGQDHPVPDTLADGSRLVRCMRVMLLAGTMLSTALVLELLVGAAVWANSHAGPPGAPVDATATSRPSPMEQPGPRRANSERPDHIHPAAVHAAQATPCPAPADDGALGRGRAPCGSWPMGMIPVLLLDDNAEFRAMVADEVRAAGFDPTEAATVAEAEALVLRGIVRFEALLLDVSLPDGDGCDLCARLRAARQRMPVLMLAGSDAEDDVVRGLDAGLDDYLVKPVRASVLIARLLVTTRVGYRLAAPTEGPREARVRAGRRRRPSVRIHYRRCISPLRISKLPPLAACSMRARPERKLHGGALAR